MMKKVISLLLIVVMVCSLGVTAFAAIWESVDTDYTNGTQVQYVGQGAESYTITVPARLTPGDEGTVTLSGTWASNHTVKVTADATVTLTNSINANDKKVLNVTFAGIEKAGDNTVSRTYTEKVAVAEMPADALFGTWSGTFYYNVSMSDVAGGSGTVAPTPDPDDGGAVEPDEGQISFTIDGTSYLANEGMTWAEWVESDYATTANTSIAYGIVYAMGGQVRTPDNKLVGPSNVIENGEEYHI